MVDLFTQLTQCFDVISKLECPDPEVTKRYMKRFAKTIVRVLIGYTDIVKKEYKTYVDQEKKVSRSLFSLWFMQFGFNPTGLCVDQQYSTIESST